MSRYKKLAKNVGLIGIGSFASKFLVFALLPLYTSILSTSEYGIIDTLTIILNFTMPIFVVMIYDGTMRFSLDKNVDKGDVLSISLYVVTLGVLAFFIFALSISSVDIIGDYYFEFVLLFATWTFYQMITYFCRGIEKVVTYMIAGIIATAGAIVFNIIFLVFLDLGITGYLLAYSFAYIVSLIYMIFSIKGWKFIKSPRRINKALGKDMFRYVIPLIPNAVSWWVCNYAARYIIIMFFGYSAAGIFAASAKMATIVTTIGIIFLNAWRISAVESFGSEESKKFYNKIFEIYSTFSFILASSLILSSKFIGYVLYANEFFVAWKYSAVLVIGACLYKLADFVMTIYTSSKKTKNIFKITMIGACVSVLSSALIVQALGVMGAAIGMVIGYMTILVYALIDTRKIMILNIDYKGLVSTIILLMVQATIVIMDISYISIIAAIIIFLMILYIKRRSLIELKNMVLTKLKSKNK